ncbi:FecCD family ABC transporter permease [Phytoactinopolyspora limicola]|uniref:FecCD family ABC transporter permease n=1 Tax=Phytoactinopolyspora limicola TaxID=2715536 RepID=UPI00140BEF92|nr:iron chelate uptake ABC transporter family permease subunit [Phytoactinopolyspora limicola]
MTTATNNHSRSVAHHGDLSRRRHHHRVATVCVALLGACGVAFGAALSIGDVDVSLTAVLGALTGNADDGTTYIVQQLRLPRALVAVMAGAALGLSGAVFQSLLRNPLASPDIIGITPGAAAAAVIALLVLGLDGYAVSVAAVAGALGVTATIYGLAWRHGVSGYRLVLVGIAVAAVMTSVVSYCLTRSDVYEARQALGWLAGSLNAKTWPTVQILASAVAILIPLALLAGRQLRVLLLGDDTARALGAPVERARLALIAVAVGLAAVATAAAGPVVFVAFVSGPIARRLIGGDGTTLVPAALVGALIMTSADLAGQHALPTLQLPVGVVTAIVGAPYLLWLLTVTNRAGRGG